MSLRQSVGLRKTWFERLETKAVICNAAEQCCHSTGGERCYNLMDGPMVVCVCVVVGQWGIVLAINSTL